MKKKLKLTCERICFVFERENETEYVVITDFLYRYDACINVEYFFLYLLRYCLSMNWNFFEIIPLVSSIYVEQFLSSYNFLKLIKTHSISSSWYAGFMYLFKD